jgi:hypothetical protein
MARCEVVVGTYNSRVLGLLVQPPPNGDVELRHRKRAEGDQDPEGRSAAPGGRGSPAFVAAFSCDAHDGCVRALAASSGAWVASAGSDNQIQ